MAACGLMTAGDQERAITKECSVKENLTEAMTRPACPGSRAPRRDARRESQAIGPRRGPFRHIEIARIVRAAGFWLSRPQW